MAAFGQERTLQRTVMADRTDTFILELESCGLAFFMLTAKIR